MKTLSHILTLQPHDLPRGISKRRSRVGKFPTKMSSFNNNIISSFIKWDIYQQDHDAGYLPTILHFHIYLYLHHGRRAMLVLVTFDDYIVRNDGTISLFIEFVDPGYILKTLTLSPSCNDYQQVLNDSLKATYEKHGQFPDTSTLPSSDHFIIT